MPERLARGQALLEQVARQDLREQDLDQRQRAHLGGRLEREGQKPHLRGEGAHEAREQRGPPGAKDGHQHRAVGERKIGGQHHRLDDQAERQRRRGGHHEVRRLERADAAAKADGGDGEQRARGDAEQRRLPGEGLLGAAARPRHDQHAGRRDQDGERRAPSVTWSPRKARPKTATCTGSVLA